MKWIKTLVIAACMLTLSCPAFAKQTDYFKTLQERLVSDGFIAKGIHYLYKQPGVDFDVDGVSLYFVHTESKLNYDQFLDPKPIQNAKNYMLTHKTRLTEAEKNYGVDREVITAIALVETRLGTYTGNRSVFNTLSSMAALGDKNVRNALWKKIESKSKMSLKRYHTKADQKAGWAYKELKAFLNYTAKENVTPLDIIGSYAGAMGICQFMPSNIKTLAKDGNNDGRVDLFDHADAIMSIANYLKHYGWKPGIKSKKAYDVVYRYNHSSYYVKTVLKIADKLKG